MCDGERLWEGKIQPGHEAVGRDHHCNTGYGKQSSVSFLKLTVDSPSLHPSGFMLILDLQIKTNNKIIYKFYKKEVSNNLVILNKLAMPKKVKKITCIQEVIRRLRNSKRELSWSIKREILTEFPWSLYQSPVPAIE